jgi:uracil-DNA glycosylase family 4
VFCFEGLIDLFGTIRTIMNLLEIEKELIQCRCCPRLTAWREEVARVKRRAFLDQDYWGKPVPGFGDPNARLLILGLAPGAHGSNRTGRMFTGDGSGDFLYPALFKAGFASQPEAWSSEDGMKLKDVFITAVCHCVPPGNKPTRKEISNCLPWLVQELGQLRNLQGIILLGKIALDGLLSLPAYSEVAKSKIKFGHEKFYELREGLPWILCSYHPSRQNTQTGRLTTEMFDSIWQNARERLK